MVMKPHGGQSQPFSKPDCRGAQPTLPVSPAEANPVRGNPPSVRLGLFSSFYPRVDRVAPAGTGMVLLLSQASEVERVTCYVPFGSSVPESHDTSKVVLKSSWAYDDPVSLIRTIFHMILDSRSTDLFIFNIYLTSFGDGAISNGIGLLLPIVLARVSRARVLVYMHNLVETQELESLGYGKRKASAWIASIIERLLVSSVRVVVPLRAQSKCLMDAHGWRLPSLILPYIDGVSGVSRSVPHAAPPPRGASEHLRVLLFGAWGPQKDLEGAVSMLSEISSSGFPLEVLIAGSLNSGFKSRKDEYLRVLSRLPRGLFSFYGNLPFSDVPPESVQQLMHSVDVLLLPYNAAGGYSSIMSIAALHGLPIISYDVAQLREFDGEIQAGTIFIAPRDAGGLLQALHKVKSRKRATDADILGNLTLARGRMLELVTIGMDRESARQWLSSGGPERRPQV